MHFTVPPGTEPLEVCGLKVQVTVSTRVPTGCSTVIVALVNARSVIDSVQFVLGQSGAPAIIVGGATVVTAKGVVPFLIALAGIASDPLTVIGAGFCPGAWLPPWLVQFEVTSAVAVRVTSTSPFPSPDSAPAALSVRPLSVKLGFAFAPPFKWTLEAKATEAVRLATTNSVRRTITTRRILVPPFLCAMSPIDGVVLANLIRQR